MPITEIVIADVGGDGEGADCDEAGGAAAGPDSGNADDSRMCVVCFDQPRDAVLVPCGHADTCMTCAREIAERNAACPMCRCRITEALRFGAEHRTADGDLVMTSPGGFKVVQV